MPPPKQKPIAADLIAGVRARELVDGRPSCRRRTAPGGTAERRGGLRRVGERRRAALLGEQVDRERRVAAGGEPAGDRADVVGEAAVLVDDQDRAARASAGPRRPAASGPRAGERDRLGRQRRGPAGPLAGRARRGAAPARSAPRRRRRRRATARPRPRPTPSRPRRRSASRRLISRRRSRPTTSSVR